MVSIFLKGKLLLYILAIFLKGIFARLKPTTTTTTEEPSTFKDELRCYQCLSDCNEAFPVCDTDFFTTLYDEELDALKFQCPKELPNFCVKKELMTKGTENKRTYRGCSANVDEKDNTLRVGCMRIHTNQTITETCFCDTDYCNFARKNSGDFWRFIALFLSVQCICLYLDDYQ